MRQSNRFTSFDAMRSTLAIWGVILHVLLVQLILLQSNLPQSPEVLVTTSARGSAFFLLWIHSFRLPLFFAISGFFSFSLLRHFGQLATLKNRLQRITIPFLVLWLVPIVYEILLLSINHAIKTVWHQTMNLNFIGDIGTFWFLYYLTFIDLFFLIIIVSFGKLLPKIRLINPKIIISLLFIGTIVSFMVADRWYSSIDFTIKPILSLLFLYGLFFCVGCVVAEIYPKLTNHATWLKWRTRIWSFGSLASFILFCGYFILFNHYQNNLYAKTAGEIVIMIVGWISIVSFFAFFETIASKPNTIWRYLSGSAYWIYIAQMPLISLFSVIFYYNKISIFISTPLTTLFTVALLLLSYHWLIRGRRCFKYIN